MSNNIQWPQLGGGGGGAVDSVNGQTGTVVLNKSDIGLGQVDNKSLTDQNLAEKDPTGFPNRTDSGISFVDFTRTLFISATGASFDVWIKGTKYTFPSLLAIGKQIPPTTGLWWFYFNQAGSLEVTNSFSSSLFTDNAIVAVVYWNQSLGTHTYFGDERHGMMDVDTHSYLHTVFGARYISGLALQGFVPDGSGGFDNNAQFSSDIGQIRDEDILHSINGQSQFPVLYRVGDDWYKKPADNFPVIYNGTAGYSGSTIAFNEYVAPNWQLSPVTSGNFICIHLFATNDVDAGVVAILGTAQYANAPQARAGAETEINSISGLPFAEFCAIGTVIFQTNSAYTNTPKAKVVSSNPAIGEVYVDFRGEQLYTPSGVASSHSLLSNLGADDHLQYHNDVRGDARYLQLTGGTMTGAITGDLTVTGNVIAPNVPYIPPVYGSEASARAVFSTSTLSNYGGMTNGNTGTNALAVYDNTTPIGRIPHVTYTTTSTSGSTTGHRLTASFYALGTGARWKTTFKVDDATTVANARHFCGVNTSSSATAINTSVNNNPLMTSLTNFFAFASDAGAGDTNFCIYHNAGTAGATTRIDLGANFPNTNTGEIYHVTFYNPQGSLEVYYEVVAVNAQQKAIGLISGNLPTTALLYLHCERFNAGSASVVRMQGGSLLSWVL